MLPWFALLSTFCAYPAVYSYSGEIRILHEPSHCAIDEYFNVNQLKCIVCDSEKNLVPSGSGMTCVCNDRSRIVAVATGAFPVCEECPDGTIPTKDMRDCIGCPVERLVRRENKTVCETFDCPPNHASIERHPNGTLLGRLLCVGCGAGTRAPPGGGGCLPCRESLTAAQKATCECSAEQRLVDGLCVGADLLGDFPDERETFTVAFQNGRKVQSQFLRDNLLRAVALCKMGDLLSCQLLANMCVMNMYSDEEKSSPCSLFRERKRAAVSDGDALPWIYYGEGEASTVLYRRKITARYRLDKDSEMSYLNLTGVFYNADGSLHGIEQVSGAKLQLCPGSWGTLDAGLRFASNYLHRCEVSAQQLLRRGGTQFVDLFLHYRDSDGENLHAIPVLIKNLGTGGDSYGNRGVDRTRWQLVRRFFFVERLAGVRYDREMGRSERGEPEVVRYLKSAELNVKLQGTEEEGKIFVPYMVLDYGELSAEEIARDETVALSFAVNYEMDSSLSHALEVSMAAFSALALVWSIVRTWSHSRRSGRLVVDAVTLSHLVLFACGNLANVFFLIVFCASLDIFVFFKGQSAVHVLLPRANQEETLKIYVIVAFLLKIVEVCHLIYGQITIDIFFIDWERPRARNLVPRSVLNGPPNPEFDEEQPVSIWRTYFVANEWNEIQTKRKLNTNIHLVITVLVLKCFGIERWTTTDPDLFRLDPVSVGESSCFVCRLAVGGLVFLAVYAAQWLFVAGFYERYIKNGIQEFVDVCSMANISVFILAQENYGFYIHGRSAHGFADTDMQSILNQLKREEEDLVGHRGLLPGTDQQTFEMIVPAQLRSYYRKVMAPLQTVGQSMKRLGNGQAAGARLRLGPDSVDKSIRAYRNMNRFLAAFLEHALKDLDYEVREKMFTESLLGIEFVESPDKGVLFSDNGHSFDNVLFYGNEFILMTFDVMLFCFAEALAGDFLVAGIVTACVNHLTATVRDLGGRKNLAKKTLIDERFLI